MSAVVRKDRKIVVIGGGYAGLFSARSLVAAGYQVSMVFARDNAAEASPLSQGILSSKGLTQADAELFAAKLAGQKALREEVARKNSVRIEGILEPFRDSQECERIATRVYRKQDYQSFGTEKFSRDHSLTHGFEASVTGAYYYPHDFWLDVDAFLSDLRSDLVRSGVEFYYDEIHSFSTYQSGWEVHGKRQSIFCDELVLAAGIGTDSLLAASGCPTLGLAPSHGVVLRGEVKDKSLSFAFVREMRSAIIHNGVVRLGGTATAEWQEGDEEVHASTLRQELAPFIRADILQDVQWRTLRGIRAKVKDRMPVVGPWQRCAGKKPVYLCTGLYKNGLALADACAAYLTQMIDGDQSVEGGVFDVRRLLR